MMPTAFTVSFKREPLFRDDAWKVDGVNSIDSRTMSESGSVLSAEYWDDKVLDEESICSGDAAIIVPLTQDYLLDDSSDEDYVPSPLNTATRAKSGRIQAAQLPIRKKNVSKKNCVKKAAVKTQVSASPATSKIVAKKKKAPVKKTAVSGASPSASNMKSKNKELPQGVPPTKSIFALVSKKKKIGLDRPVYPGNHSRIGLHSATADTTL
jgi:hypothetical protein